MFAFLNHWSNAPFLVMLGLVAVIVFLQAAGLVGLVMEGGEGGLEGGEAEGDVDHDVNIDGEHDVEVNHDTFSAQATHVASYFGIGRVPLMVLAVTWLLFTGFSGIFFNSLAYVRFEGAYHQYPSYPAWVLPTTYGMSLAAGLVATRFFSRVLGRIFDFRTRGATSKHELSGRIGIVASPQLGPKFGEIRVRDERGNELLVHARIETGEEPLQLGEEVILVDYDPESEMFLATQFESRIDRPPIRNGPSKKGRH